MKKPDIGIDWSIVIMAVAFILGVFGICSGSRCNLNINIGQEKPDASTR